MKNSRRPEVSIIERYVAEEAIEFCTEYLAGHKFVGLLVSRHKGRYHDKGTRGCNVQRKTRVEVHQEHLCTLNNNDKVEPYLAEHKKSLKAKKLSIE